MKEKKRKMMPNVLPEYVTQMISRLSSFYQACVILSGADTLATDGSGALGDDLWVSLQSVFKLGKHYALKPILRQTQHKHKLTSKTTFATLGSRLFRWPRSNAKQDKADAKEEEDEHDDD